MCDHDTQFKGEAVNLQVGLCNQQVLEHILNGAQSSATWSSVVNLIPVDCFAANLDKLPGNGEHLEIKECHS